MSVTTAGTQELERSRPGAVTAEGPQRRTDPDRSAATASGLSLQPKVRRVVAATKSA
jgi:hypothetical protein